MSVDMKISLDVWHGKCHLMGDGSLTIKTKGYMEIILHLRGLQQDKRSGNKTDVKPKVSNE